MRKWMYALAVTLLPVMVVSGNGAETEKSEPAPKGVITSNRNTPVKAAIAKTRDSIVHINIDKDGKQVVGTGVIIDERGYIVTNRHVVNGATKIVVKHNDGTEYVGEITMQEPAYDLAVIKVRADKKFKALRIGPASDLEEGETVIALGSPYGFARSKTVGIVSRTDCSLSMPGPVELRNLIQHSAPIDPGNSGGPLLNLDGELVGINVAVHDKARVIGFAINADDVQRVLTKHLSALKLTGLNHGLTTKVELQEAGAERQKVIILDVEENTPSAAAGLKFGDQLVTVGGYDVTNKFDVERAFWDAQGTVTVTVIRKGEQMQVKLNCSSQSARSK